jgi:hypothetical protein
LPMALPMEGSLPTPKIMRTIASTIISSMGPM